ncbi:Polymer-forming cytoskeletal [compost metagenome]
MYKANKRQATTDTLIGQGTLGEGKMICEAGLRIEGEYRGDIECKGDVVIGEVGIARSNISARDVTVAGQVIGDIVTSGKLVITSTGKLFGNISAHTLVIQEGGRLNGISEMEAAGPSKAREQSASQSQAGKEASAAKEGREKTRQAG